jgi:hypothetical protein
MRRWASFRAMRLISWIDQRIKNDTSVEAAIAFFWARRWLENG